MNDLQNSPQNEQDRYLNMMPNYSSGPVPVEEFRVGFGRRFAASIIDFIIYMIAFVVAMQVFGTIDYIDTIDFGMMASDTEGFNLKLEALNLKLAPLTLAIGIIYYSMEVLFAATPGKIMLGIKIGTADRHYANTFMLFKRFIIKNISYVFIALFIISSASIFQTLSTIMQLVIFGGFFMVLAYSKQALHDKIAGTAVFFKDEFLGYKQETLAE